MKLIFKNEHIIPELKSATGLQTIGEMVEHLVSVGALSSENAEPIADAIRQRENSMSTGLGFGVAIPHASTPLIKDTIVAFGRSRKGIDFDALDHQPVRLVALVVVPVLEKESHFLTLACISRLLHGKPIRAALEEAEDGDAISNILNETQSPLVER